MVIAQERFFKYVEKTDGCWNWIGLKAPNGYGRFGLSKAIGMKYAHRVSYEFHNGEIETGKLVCHSCDNRACVNPEHLWVGTYMDNNRDRVLKGRKARMPQSKLDEVKAFIIRLIHPVFTMDLLAKRFDVTKNAIWQVTNRKSWISNHSNG